MCTIHIILKLEKAKKMRVVLEVECKILCFLKYDMLCSIKSFCVMMKGCGLTASAAKR